MSALQVHNFFKYHIYITWLITSFKRKMAKYLLRHYIIFILLIIYSFMPILNFIFLLPFLFSFSFFLPYFLSSFLSPFLMPTSAYSFISHAFIDCHSSLLQSGLLLLFHPLWYYRTAATSWWIHATHWGICQEHQKCQQE